jgi:hypothetical protein
MAEILTKLVVDLSKGKNDPLRVQSIPLTADEITEREAMAVEAEAQRVTDEEAAQALADLKTSARAKLVAGEPLTEAEAATLVI